MRLTDEIKRHERLHRFIHSTWCRLCRYRIGIATAGPLPTPIPIGQNILKNGDFQSGTNFWWTYNPQGFALFSNGTGFVTIAGDLTGTMGAWGQTVYNIDAKRTVQVNVDIDSTVISAGGVDPGVGIVLDQYDGVAGVGQIGNYLGGLDTPLTSASFKGTIGNQFQLDPRIKIINYVLVVRNMKGTTQFSNAILSYQT